MNFLNQLLRGIAFIPALVNAMKKSGSAGNEVLTTGAAADTF
jgi:hypothetical protein